MKETGLGARLEARFRPAWHWGGEFLADRVRLCALREADGKAVAGEVFAGTYAEAEAFARSRGLAYRGLHAAVSHLPFKIAPLEASAGEEEDVLPQAERLRPQGLPADSLDLQVFSQGGARFLAMAREDVLRGFREGLPEPLGGFWDLTASPLALLPRIAQGSMSGTVAALWLEAGFAHALFFRDGTLESYLKVFAGLEGAARDPAAFALEMKKALVYHYGSRYPGASLAALQIWRDGPGGEASAALRGLGIPQVSPAWAGLPDGIPDEQRVAAALAWQGALGGGPAVGFAVPANRAAASRRLWMRRAGALARVGYQAFLVLAAGVALLSLAALGLRFAVDAKTRSWAGELNKWDEFQKRKEVVEIRLGTMQGLLERRTEAYASLQRIAAGLPAEVWLDAWEAEAGTGPGGGFTHRLSGYSLVESRVAELLANLEKSRPSGAVKLKSTERIKGEAVEKKTGIQANHRDLVRFQVGVSE